MLEPRPAMPRLLTLLAAALAAAGCAAGGLNGMMPRGPAVLEHAELGPEELAAIEDAGADPWLGFAFEEMPLAEPTLFPNRLGQGLGVGVALVAPRDEARDWLEDGYYVHLRYIYELSTLFAWEFDTGIYKADNKLAGIVPGQKDVEALPIRATLQVTTDIPQAPARMYLYLGGGYFIYDDDDVDDEWGTHFGLGVEVGGLTTNFGTRVEAGHLRLIDSDVNQWTGALVFYYKF